MQVKLRFDSEATRQRLRVWSRWLIEFGLVGWVAAFAIAEYLGYGSPLTFEDIIPFIRGGNGQLELFLGVTRLLSTALAYGVILRIAYVLQGVMIAYREGRRKNAQAMRVGIKELALARRQS